MIDQVQFVKQVGTYWIEFTASNIIYFHLHASDSEI